ncbi:importin-13 isoform X2 [Cryptosporidium felis]|nr:importin-13 isoform X2 [Cryptosporidium felis]
MNFSRELVHSKILELWTSGDSLRRADANKYLLDFKESVQAWQVCKELLSSSSEPEVQYVAAQTLCQKVSTCRGEIQASGGPKVIFEEIYSGVISEKLRNGGVSISPLLGKLGEGLSYLVIMGISDGSWPEGFEYCLRISEPYFANQGTGSELWIVLNMLRYIPDASVFLESQKRPILIQSTLPRILDIISESISKIMTSIQSPSSLNSEISQKLLEMCLDILTEYFEKFEIPLFTHKPLSSAISKLMKTEICVAPYRLAELFVRGLPRCSYYMQKQGAIGDPNTVFTLAEDANGLHILLKFPSEAETSIIMSLLDYLRLLYEKLRQVPLPSSPSKTGHSSDSGAPPQMIRINTWSTLKMSVPQIELDEDTERSILSWSGVIFSLLEGYAAIFVIGESPEVKSRCGSQGKALNNPASFLPDMLSLLLTLHVRIPGVLVNIWCTLRDLVNEGVISKDQGLSIAGLLVTPAIQSLATQCRTDFFYWEKLGINENSIMNARISTYSNFGLKELTLDDSVEEFLDFLDTATLHINDIYFFLLSLGGSHGQSFVTYIQHSLLACSNEEDPVGCVVFLRFSDALIEAANSLQGTISNILELACTTLPKTPSCIYQITLLLQKSAHLLTDREFSSIWLLSLKYLIQMSCQSNLLLLASTFEELCQLGADHVLKNSNRDQILLELSQSVVQVVTSKLRFSPDNSLYANIGIIDENIGFVGGLVHILCYTMIRNNQPLEVMANTLKSFLFHTINSTMEHIPQVCNNASFESTINIGVVQQCCWIWSTYVFLKILKAFTFCLENNKAGALGAGIGVVSGVDSGVGCGTGNGSPTRSGAAEYNSLFRVGDNSKVALSLALLIQGIFSPQDQQMYILGERLKSLLFNSFNLDSESQGYGVVLISSMLFQYTRNISLHNLMLCTRRSFTGSESCLSCPKDVIVSICCLILRIISCTWSANISNGESGSPQLVLTAPNQVNQWCSWEYTYSNIKRSALSLKSELDTKSSDEKEFNLLIKQKHGSCTMLVQEILKRLPIESRDYLVNIMHNDGVESILYEFWIKKFFSITNTEISRSMEPFFMWQISQLGNNNAQSLSVQVLLSSQYLTPSLDVAARSLQLNDKYLINTVLVYLTKLTIVIHAFPQIHVIWTDQLPKLVLVLFSVYHNFEKNSLLQMCKFVSQLLDCFSNSFFLVINEMFSPDFPRFHPEIKVNPFQDANQQEQSVILACFRNLRGPRLRQFLQEISNVTNGINSMNNCLSKFQVLLVPVGERGLANNTNPITIS